MNTPLINIESNLRAACPDLILGQIICSVNNSNYNADLWQEIKQREIDLQKQLKIEDIKHITTINATRNAYRACGKDPNRYRPSAEQLNRRILQGKGLYQISTLVDLVNLVSFVSGYSIGGFDVDKINGDLNYGIGEIDEAYEGIGRGVLNIAGMPILRDEIGGVGTPTSDEMRTRVTPETQWFLININGFDGNVELMRNALRWSESLLKKYADAVIIDSKII